MLGDTVLGELFSRRAHCARWAAPPPPWAVGLLVPSPGRAPGGFCRGLAVASVEQETPPSWWVLETTEALLDVPTGPNAPALSSGADSRGWGSCTARPAYLLPAHSLSGKRARLVLAPACDISRGSWDPYPFPKPNQSWESHGHPPGSPRLSGGAGAA